MARAMVLRRPREALVAEERPLPSPGANDVVIRVGACAVCRTDLHVTDGELPHPKLPLVPGHQVVGRVIARGRAVTTVAEGARVGVPWLGGTCGACRYCERRRENLCERAVFTGYTRDGGFATHMAADASYVFPLPDGGPDGGPDDAELAPLLCGGLIGFRALRLAGDAERLGLFGFGNAAHIVAQVAAVQGRRIFAFTRAGDDEAQALARSLGAEWAGSSDDDPPEPLDAALVFAPVGALVPRALAVTDKGGVVVCAGIHMSDIPTFPYRLLWEERQLRSVANLTREDGELFLPLAARLPVKTVVQRYALDEANEALAALRGGRVRGAAVLVCR